LSSAFDLFVSIKESFSLFPNLHLSACQRWCMLFTSTKKYSLGLSSIYRLALKFLTIRISRKHLKRTY